MDNEKINGYDHEHDSSPGQGFPESTPFLRSSFDSNHDSELPSPPDVNSPAEKKARRFRARVTILIALLIVAVDLPAVMFNTSMVRILESIYCREYYTLHDPSKFGANGKIEEQLCKIEDVQSQLSSLRGWMSFFSHLPGLFLAVPFGMIADKYGRKWLFVMNILSMQGRTTWQYIVCSYPHVIPLKFIWLESVLTIFGGGSMVATALIFVTLSDVTPTVSMASTFFRLGAANMLCFTVGPPIAAALMKKDPWLPFTLGLGLQALAIPMSFFLPETLGAKKPGEAGKQKDSSESSSPVYDEKSNVSRSRSSRIMRSVTDNAGFLLKDWRIIFLAATYPIRMTMSSLDSQTLQYVPQRFHWSIADATNLQAIQSGISMLLLLLILPSLSSYLLNRRSFSTNRKDLLLTRIGFTSYGASLLTMGFAPLAPIFIIGLMIGTFAAGCGAAIRALLTSWVLPNEVARLYTLLGIIETIGSMGGGPIISSLYNVGLAQATKGKGDVLLGLPWIITGSIMSCVAVTTFVLKFGISSTKEDVESKGGFAPVPMTEDDEIGMQDLERERGMAYDPVESEEPKTPVTVDLR